MGQNKHHKILADNRSATELDQPAVNFAQVTVSCCWWSAYKYFCLGQKLSSAKLLEKVGCG